MRSERASHRGRLALKRPFNIQNELHDHETYTRKGNSTLTMTWKIKIKRHAFSVKELPSNIKDLDDKREETFSVLKREGKKTARKPGDLNNEREGKLPHRFLESK